MSVRKLYFTVTHTHTERRGWFQQPEASCGTQVRGLLGDATCSLAATLELLQQHGSETKLTCVYLCLCTQVCDFTGCVYVCFLNIKKVYGYSSSGLMIHSEEFDMHSSLGRAPAVSQWMLSEQKMCSLSTYSSTLVNGVGTDGFSHTDLNAFVHLRPGASHLKRSTGKKMKYLCIYLVILTLEKLNRYFTHNNKHLYLHKMGQLIRRQPYCPNT